MGAVCSAPEERHPHAQAAQCRHRSIATSHTGSRRAFLVSAAAFLTAPLAAGEPKGRAYRIGVLESIGEQQNARNLDAFRRALRGLGYVEGVSYAIEYRSADGRAERFPDLATELVQLNVDVIVTRGTPAAFAARRATGTIPIVMASSGDPAAEGIVARLPRPGGNVTGFHTMAPPEVAGRRLKFLKEALPGSSRVGVFCNPATHHTPLLVREMEKVARAMAIRLETFEVRGAEDLERSFEAALLRQIDSLVTVEDYLIVTHRTRIVSFAAASRLPAIHGLREFVEAGGLMAYGIDREDLFRRSAVYVHRILEGAYPADLPVEAPTKFELVINLKAAKTLGLTFPPSLLSQADHLID
jgi:putative ABC transport system substrate-binding protein